MPTTTNNGWTTPADTDLVKNGALAIRTLGNAIDTTLGVYAAPGLVKISGASFTTASSVSLPNSTFTSTYRNYRLLITGTASVTSETDLALRFRASGTDNSSTNYFRWSYNRTNSAAGNSYNGGIGNSILGSVGNITFYSEADIFQPQASANTMFTSTGHCLANSNNNSYWLQGGYNGTDSFDSLTFYPSSGTITGQYVIYGYKA